ncbi:MAG: acyl-CoA carboxylase subunit beta [Candidatus Muiribacteriota bacterium]
MSTGIERLKKIKDQIKLGGGEKRIEKQHNSGKLTARERINILVDPGSFVELDAFVTHRCTDFGLENKKPYGDGVITGYGTISGRLIYVFAQDFTVVGGAVGEMHAKKICKLMDMAAKNGAPVIGLNDSGGAKIQEGVMSLCGYGEIFYRNSRYSGVVPQIAAIMGPCAGGAVYSPGIMDFIFMVEDTSNMFITGPNVIKTVTNEEISKEELGGASAHMEVSGVCHFTAPTDEDCLERIKKLFSYLPSNNMENPPFIDSGDDPHRLEKKLNSIVPENPNKPYSMKELIKLIVDSKDFFEVQKKYSENIIIGFARLGGRSVGIIANNPQVLAGTLDVEASMKGARFIRFCDSFNIPLITFVDTPGFLPGRNQEHNGIIKHGAKMLYAYSEACVPKLTVITRKAYGGAYIVMCSKHLGADFNVAWPTSEVAVMGPNGAINIIFRKDMAEAENPEVRKEELIGEYKEKFANPYLPASLGYLDDIIEPSETRWRLISALDTLIAKKDELPAKKHGNIPL